MRAGNRRLPSLIFALSICALSATFSCNEQNKAEEKIGVVVSILPLADFTKHVGKDKVDVTVMVPPGASPHTYEPKPIQLRALSQAKMFVAVGSGVEFELVWMDKLIQMSPNMMMVNGSEGIELMDRDPHIWLSPANAMKMVQNISAGLIRLDPAGEESYSKNTSEYLKELHQLDKYIRERLDAAKSRSFIAYHPAWGYLARDYRLELIPVERAGKEPTAEEMKEVVEKARTLEKRIVFVSPQFATKGAETVAREIGGFTLFLDPLPRSYIPDMRAAVGKLEQALR